MKKIILTLVCSLVIAIAVFISIVLWKPYYNVPIYEVGNSIFPQIHSSQKIYIQTPSYQMCLDKKNDIWMANGYYADYQMLLEYLYRLQTAEIEKKITCSSENQVKISVYGDKHDETFFIYENDDYSKSIIKIKEKCFLINKNIQPPGTVSDYFLQPLFPFNDDKIEILNNFHGNMDFFFSLKYQGAVHQNIDKSLCRFFTIISSKGLKLNCHVCKDNNLYFININLQTTVMPTTEIAQFVAQNKYRYDPWYFILNADDGAYLYENLSNNQSKSAL